MLIFVDLVLVMKLPLITSAKVPSYTTDHGWVFFFFFLHFLKKNLHTIKLKHQTISEQVFCWKFPVLLF